MQAEITLRLLVVDDRPLAGAIGRFEGEWKAFSRGSLKIQNITARQLLETKRLEADVLIYPSHYLGTLVEAGQVVPIRTGLLKAEQYDLADIFSLVKEREIVWGKKPYALPLGSPSLVLYYRADIFKQLKIAPPKTWDQYVALLPTLADRAKLGELAPEEESPWLATCEPLAGPWAAKTFLAHAASYARHSSNYSTQFDTETMEPRIATAPFAKGLEDLVAVAKAQGTLRLSPGEVRQKIYAGETAMALTWPSPAATIDRAAGNLEIGIAEIPVAEKTYNPRSDRWEEGQPGSHRQGVTLLAYAGRLASVTSNTNNTATAMRFAAWLTSRDVSVQVATASSYTTLFRKSQMRSPRQWTEKPLPLTAARRYLTIQDDAQQRLTWMSIPRIPGSDEYLAALGEAIHSALDGTNAPEQALQSAADRWRAITNKYGVEKQRTAYERNWGLAE